MKAFTRTALAAALALGVAAPAMAQFSGVYFFGDSLSDSGSYKPVLPPGTGLFTTNPGPIWVTAVRADLRLHARRRRTRAATTTRTAARA